MAKTMTNAVKSKKQQKDLCRNLDALQEDPFSMLMQEDLESLTESEQNQKL
jgi:hypothetical protein